MKLNDVIKETGLTKKAIYFYEEMGLISPGKDEENNYREFSEQNVNDLITISALRKLDFTVKEIQQILAGNENLAGAVQTKIKAINGEIGRLQENKRFLEQLGRTEHPDLDAIRQLADLKENESKFLAGYMQKELERIMPGNVGKMFAINYGVFLDEPLDTPEKEKAWRGLIRYLDAQDEIQYPKDILDIVDEMYGRYSDDQWMGVAQKVKSVADNIMNNTSSVDDQQKAELEFKLEEYQKSSDYQRFLKFQTYMVENLAAFFQDVEKYVCALSGRFAKFNTILRDSALAAQQ